MKYLKGDVQNCGCKYCIQVYFMETSKNEITSNEIISKMTYVQVTENREGPETNLPPVVTGGERTLSDNTTSPLS